MSPLTQPLPVNDNRVVRLRQENGPCHIAGGIEDETPSFFRTIKTYGGYFIRKRIAKQKAHVQRCPHCPDETLIREIALRPGIDPKSVRKQAS